jgi:hypothetical protein
VFALVVEDGLPCQTFGHSLGNVGLRRGVALAHNAEGVIIDLEKTGNHGWLKDHNSLGLSLQFPKLTLMLG